MAKCNCNLCERSRKFKRILKILKAPWEKNLYSWIDKKDRFYQAIKWLEDLYNHLINVEIELDWYKKHFQNQGHAHIQVDETMIDPDDWVCIVGSSEK